MNVKQFSSGLKSYRRVLSLLVWVATVLLVAGLLTRFVTGVWTALALGLALGGIVLGGAVLWMRWQFGSPREGESWWRRRSVQSSTNAIMAALALVVILGLINFLVVRYPARLDVTETRFFSLAPQTQTLMRELDQPLQVLIFDRTPDPQQRTLLEEYQRYNAQHFRFEFVDPQAQPGLTRRYNVRNPGDVVIETGERNRVLEGTLSETNLTPAIAALLQNRQAVAYAIQGHGEVPLSGEQTNLQSALTALERQGVQVVPLNLIEQQGVPEDANLVIIAGPTRPFLAAEVELLATYLETGGSALFLLDPETETGLDPLLRQWGVTLDNRIVVDGSGSGQLIGLSPAAPLVLEYGDHPITEALGQSVSFYPLAQAIMLTEQPDIEGVELLRTGQQSWAEADPDQEQLQFDAERDLPGPLTLGVALRRDLSEASTEADSEPEVNDSEAAVPPVDPVPESDPTEEARLVVIGNSDFATTSLFDQGVNGDVFLNSVNWLSRDQSDPTLSIRPKEPTNRRLEMTPMQSRFLTGIGLGLLPLGAFGLAITLWWQRR
ncbi:ABC transporter [Synechococcales cyanobacterium C]|uniref:ABC transporter n=1 Tax=Petrachloros mirabilis ULC683 TaxID=2781853 RepID=A0A8K1ZVK2_9CYAN|nr:Gldg family protein [Petrachloros mirabilis]NCJ04951.1 ABC transporter [Petrachloros mirabilis ULC683]